MMFMKSVHVKEAYLILVLNLNQYSWVSETSCYIMAGFSTGAGLFNYLSQLHLTTKQINHFICLFQLSTPAVF